MFKAVVTFGVPERVVARLIEIARDKHPHLARWLVVGTDMQALSAMDARWSRSVGLTIVHAPRINAASLAAAMDIVGHESLRLDECAWIDAGVMAPMQGRAFARFVSAAESASAEVIMARLNC